MVFASIASGARLVRRRGRRVGWLGAGAVLAAWLLGPAAGAAPPEPKVLNIYNWSDYIADDTLKNFERETGIRVRYDNYDTNEILHAKLVAGRSGYDIVVPSAHFAKQQIAAGLLQKIDRTLLSHWGNLDPGLLAQMDRFDPGNQYLVDWLWGFVTVGINEGLVHRALGADPLPADPWDLIFDPRYARRLEACGVSFLDSASEVLPVAMLHVGKPAYSARAADYPAAAAMLDAVRPHVGRFSSSGYINDLAQGALCVVMGYSGDINIAAARAREARNGQVIRALVPLKGATLFFDAMAIPADAPHPRNAHRFIDYILRPEVHAALTNKVLYANPNKASLPFVRPDVAANPTIFLSDADKARMIAPDAVPPDIRRLQTRIFTHFKAGK